MKTTWKFETRLGMGGHRIFQDVDTRKYAIADDSGAFPDETEDGVLWLGSAHLVLKWGQGDGCVHVPVTTDTGKRTYTLMSPLSALLLSELLPKQFTVSVDTGERRYRLVPELTRSKIAGKCVIADCRTCADKRAREQAPPATMFGVRHDSPVNGCGCDRCQAARSAHVPRCTCGVPLDEPCLTCFPDGDDPTPAERKAAAEAPDTYMPSWDQWVERWNFKHTEANGTLIKQSLRAFDLRDAEAQLPDGVYHMDYGEDCKLAYETLEWVATDARLSRNPRVPEHRRKAYDPEGRCRRLAYAWLRAMGLPQARFFAPTRYLIVAVPEQSGPDGKRQSATMYEEIWASCPDDAWSAFERKHEPALHSVTLRRVSVTEVNRGR